MRPLKIVSLILASHYLSLGFAQEPAPPMQFGLISGEDLSMRFYEADTAAEALVLCDFGDAKVTLYPNGYRLRFAQHKRIKILKKSGFQDSIYTYERSQSS
ncbi:MAG: hypothetical protein H6577_17525 [Lewinellaceae bacterium]|nr:hypothetical protein [Saprospiraceae bacterium]MCB9339928.1 hypothetical protein [Lewinellaceae bacterium]